MIKEETVVDMLLTYIKECPNMSAYQIAKIMNRNPSDISSRLRELVKRGRLDRTAGLGPRGGYGYYIKSDK